MIHLMATVKELLAQGTSRLRGVESARLECEILLAQALGVGRAFLFAHPERVISDEEKKNYELLMERRHSGEPVAYITGVREFWSLPLRVTPDVLIPRPETEILVEAALARIPSGQRMRIAELGTGSGAIAIAVASERPECEIHASDISAGALEVARKNALDLGCSNIAFHLGSWFEPHTGSFDMVLSNPPYVAAGDPHLALGDLPFEPETALVSGPDALSAARTIVTQAPGMLNPGGWLIFEHSFDSGVEARRAMGDAGFLEVETRKDHVRNDRVTLGRTPAQ